MATIYDTDEEEKQHLGAVHFLVSRYHLEESTIRDIYENELEKVKDGARIKTYLSVLTVRRVNDFIHQTNLVKNHII
jgi:hypothetical protein